MRIVELTAYHVHIPLLRTVRHASHTRDSNETLIIRCRLDDGTEGWGEGLPRPYITGETIDSAFEHLRKTNLKSQLSGPIDHLRDAIEICDRIDLASIESNARDCFGNAVRCAIELSVLDAVARIEQRPLSDVTELIPETAAIRTSFSRVRYSSAIMPSRPIKEYMRAAMFRYYGFHQTKLKVGVDGVNDAAFLKRVRRVMGKQVDIRIDANEAWTCDTLESKLEPLMASRFSSIEQPVPHAQVDGLSDVRRRIETPIMLDESLCSIGDANRAIEGGTCDLFNIRLSKCGGFISSLKMAALAHQAGLGYQLGCMVGETGILSAAGRHFASSVANIRYLEGSFDRYLVAEPLTLEDLTFGRGGYAPALEKPGLGITIDREALKRVTAREERFGIYSA